MNEPQPSPVADSGDLLRPKLTPPQPRLDLVPRDSLLARLNEGLDHTPGVTLLSAPAGFGKTTLVGQWLEQIGVRGQGPRAGETACSPAPLLPCSPAWVSLDAGDNEPVRFWRYVITACQAFQPGLAQSALKLLRQARQPSFETILTTFINELTQLPGRYVLVLEDYHLIISPQLHETMTFLLDYLPPTLHLVLLTRSDPPLPLARLRARGALYEFRSADLHFSLGETELFLRQNLSTSLSAEAITHLAGRTEGWAAGLRLVTLALQGRPAEEIEPFLETLAGSHRPILEYLVEEALAAQPEPVQQFLLQTTFLDRLTAPLAEAVTGRTDSQAVIEGLERANLFLTPLDATRQRWFRYHPLFAEAMVHYARQRLGEARLRELYLKASDWYEQQDLLAEAVETALVGQDYPRAARLIGRIIQPRLAQNEYHTLRGWIERLPVGLLQTQPALCFTYAMALLFTSNPGAVPGKLLEEPLGMAEQAWRAEDNRSKLGELLGFRAMVSWWRQDPAQAFRLAREALALLPAAERQWRGIGMIFTGAEEWLAGRLNQARQTLTEALGLNEAAGNIFGRLDTSLLLADVMARQGEQQAAGQRYRQLLAELEGAPMDRHDRLFRRGRALAGWARLNLEWNELQAAEQAAAEAVTIGQELDIEEVLVHGSLVLVRIEAAQGQLTPARQRLQELLARVKQPRLLRQVQAGLARLALLTGDLAVTERWLVSNTQPGSEAPRLQQEEEALLVARLLIAKGETETALDLLKQWQAEALAQGRGRSEVESLVLMARAYFAADNLPQARPVLIQALTLAQPENYRRLFLDEGEPMATLLGAVLADLKEERLAAYGQSLRFVIADLQADAASQSKIPPRYPVVNPKSKVQNLVEPLSPQEQRVLGLLVAGLSNQEIARELVVSLNTVKTHVKNIYRKLDVHSREEAADVAGQLALEAKE